MYANDFGSHCGTQWNVPTFWGTQNPYFGGFGSMPQNYGFGSMPQNYYGLGNNPYHNNLNHFGTQQTGWNYGHTVPQTTMTQPFHGYNWGMNYNTLPFNYGYTPQGYNPFLQNFQNFQNVQSFQHPFQQSVQHPFQNCR